MRIVVLLTIALALATSAHAGTLAPPKCSIDPILVGTSSGAAEAPGYRVVIRDIAGNVVAHVSVDLEFPSGLALYTTQSAGATATCATRTIRMVTDAQGTVVFRARFGGFANAPSIRALGDGMLLGTVPARATDLNADGTTDLRDLNEFRQRFFFDRAAHETDFNLDGVTDAFDLTYLRRDIMSGVSSTICL